MRARLLLAFLLLISIFSNAQIQDLAKLADGKLVYQQNLRYSDSKLFGYFFIYEKNIGIDSVTMEYVLLDKNLNKALNGTFNEPKLKSKFKREYNFCTLMGRKLIIERLYILKKFGGYEDSILRTYQIIDLESNILSSELKYVDGQFVNLANDFYQELLLNKALKSKPYVRIFTGDSINGYIENTITKDSTHRCMHFLDENLNLQWSYNYSPIKDSRNFSYYEILLNKGNTIYLGMTVVQNSQYHSYNIVALDLVSGKEKFVYQIDHQDLPYERSKYLWEIDGQLNILGSYTNRINHYYGYDFTKSLGFYRIRLDLAGNELVEKHYPWINFSQHLTLDDKGYDDKKYKLMPRQYFMLKDGSISILTEQYKPYYSSLLKERKPCTDNFVLMNFDREMNLVRLDTIAKVMSKNNITDYHFSEYIHDRQGVVIFYVNSFKADRKQQVMLGINTLINGVITEEKIPLFSKKKFAIYPMPAKEGYVMLREVNKKEKLNKIRLEKLNYDAL